MRKRALVVGLGIAGMSAAIGLRRAGWTPVIVERAPERRTGGYFIALFPEGRRAAVDLGVVDHLHTRTPEWKPDGSTWALTRRGRRKPAPRFLDQPDGPAAVLRGDIESALWRSVAGDGVEVRFATTPVAITEGAAGVEVLLESADTGARYRENFDLVVGADGMRSSVRRIAFGPHEDYLTKWNAMICAFQLKEQVPSFEASDSVVDARSKRAVWVFGFADHAPTTLLTYRTKDIQEQFTGSRVQRLRSVFSGMDSPVVRHVLDSLEQTDDFLFDSVHQVRMPKWSARRVVLVGDAAWCMNLYSGMGATSSLRGGAALGAALREHPHDLTAALDAWEAGLRPFITKHQRAARLKQQMFVPSSRRAEVLRSAALDLLRKVHDRRITADTTAPRAPVSSGTTR
ncbi:2-polyprenyl-6-methoxyphenol hydroxylase-like FAD-dependent oxidoreductase [Saccharothrix coeruleofusca]|uniref:FAD-dependent monooxygenase n=1 Tax=Saccharothrix coeruleofusca TaxID=33919 RepID=UPI001AEB6653|nr:FAD-dependent monooxygenase [Saccharothrix coeruleofusca]MBP2337281.1 2-polyprenyl-6-methoxyphenol hydroxylase-like FAD-dependent oxidoreductase [Saccharothrix coeruleofusca]